MSCLTVVPIPNASACIMKHPSQSISSLDLFQPDNNGPHPSLISHIHRRTIHPAMQTTSTAFLIYFRFVIMRTWMKAPTQPLVCIQQIFGPHALDVLTNNICICSCTATHADIHVHTPICMALTSPGSGVQVH